MGVDFSGPGNLPFPFSVIPYIVMGGIPLVVIGALVLIGYNARVLRRRGVSAVAPQADLLGRLAQSSLLAPVEPIEARLAKLDELLAAGTITADEHAAARLKVLSE